MIRIVMGRLGGLLVAVDKRVAVAVEQSVIEDGGWVGMRNDDEHEVYFKTYSKKNVVYISRKRGMSVVVIEFVHAARCTDKNS